MARFFIWLLWPVCMVSLVACADRAGDRAGDELALAEALGGLETEGYVRAQDPRPFRFPQDHSAHPGFRNEWWYFTGIVGTEDRRKFGFQMTIFRVAMWPGQGSSAGRETRPESGSEAGQARSRAGASAWRSRQLYFAHMAVSDIDSGRFVAAQRWSRAALGLAGVGNNPLRVWVNDWSMTYSDDRWRLLAEEGEHRIDFELDPVGIPVLNGDAGLSRKSAGAGQASYYYSVPRLTVSGRLDTPGWSGPVTGLAWLDREWSTSALADDQQGWDWFALHLSDGSDLMLYQLRKTDGTIDEFSAGTFVDGNREVGRLRAGDFHVEPRDVWESPRGGTYPARWHLELPGRGLELDVVPLLADQELDTTPRYWEGAVRVSGTRHGESVTGEGYVELTGYAEQGQGVGHR